MVKKLLIIQELNNMLFRINMITKLILHIRYFIMILKTLKKKDKVYLCMTYMKIFTLSIQLSRIKNVQKIYMDGVKH